MMKRFLFGVGLTASAVAAHAGTTFVDSTSLAGFGSLGIAVDFEGVLPKDTTIAPFSVGPVNFDDEPDSNLFVSSAGYTNYGISGATTSSILTSNGDEHFTLTFSIAAKRVGFDTYTIDRSDAPNSVVGAPPVKVTVVTSAGTFTHDVVAGLDNQGFLGIVSDEDILSVTWYGKLGGVRNTGIDNVRVSEAVPEPGSLAALGLGLAALRRRRK